MFQESFQCCFWTSKDKFLLQRKKIATKLWISLLSYPSESCRRLRGWQVKPFLYLAHTSGLLLLASRHPCLSPPSDSTISFNSSSQINPKPSSRCGDPFNQILLKSSVEQNLIYNNFPVQHPDTTRSHCWWADFVLSCWRNVVTAHWLSRPRHSTLSPGRAERNTGLANTVWRASPDMLFNIVICGRLSCWPLLP